MKLVSWNVNGIRAVMKKGFTDVLSELDADFVCIQETKAQPEQIELCTDNYPYQYINSAKRKGYSGTMVLCKKKPLSIKYGINVPEFDDFNVANDEIDVPYPDMIRSTAGFSDEERESFKENLLSSLVDTYRVLHPTKIQYSWWSYRGQAREKNIGMRLDYWLVSNDLKDKVKESKILDDIYGSDHCPIMLDIDL